MPLALCFLDIERKEIEMVGVDEYRYLSPVISPDGTKMTVIGFKPGPEYSDPGYYLYDFTTRDYSLLKKFQDDKDEGFWWLLIAGYGNGTSWN